MQLASWNLQRCTIRRTVDGQRGFISAQRVLLSVQRHFRRTSPRSWTVNEGWLFTAFSACSLRASSKSPLERGGPLAVGSVCSEARFQPCDLFKIEQSLLSSKIAVFSPVSPPYILFATSFPVCRNSHPSLEWTIPLTRGFDQN